MILGKPVALSIVCLIALCGSAWAEPKDLNIGKFIVISDLHYDPYYSNPNQASCIESYKNSSTGQYGCDSPWWLVQSLLDKMYEVMPTPDFTLLLGDIFRHSITRLDVSPWQVMTDVVSPLRQAFKNRWSDNPSIFARSPILTLGNNDLYPRYPAPPATGQKDQWLTTLSSLWDSLQYATTNISVFQETGFYRVDLPNTHLSIVSIHTNYWSAENVHTADMDDPAGGFEFLAYELKTLQQEGKTVWIIGHIAPGEDHYADVPLWYSKYTDKYLATVQPYLGNTIKAQFFAHEHAILFRMINSSADSFPVFLHGSLSPIYDNNPAFRVYTYDKTTLELQDYTDYFLDITQPQLQWRTIYTSARSTYGLQSLDGSDMWNFVRTMKTDDTLFQQYIKNSWAGSPSYTACTGQCKTDALCNIEFVGDSQYRTCRAAQPTTTSSDAPSMHWDRLLVFMSMLVLAFVIV